MKLIVSKFGGTSMGGPEAFRKVKNIIKADRRRRVVVVSAVSGVTDLLLELGQAAARNESWQKTFIKIRQRHENIISELNLDFDPQPYWKKLKLFLSDLEIEKELTSRSRAYILSFGERLSSMMLESYLKNDLKAARVNSRHIIKTSNDFNNARLHQEKTKRAVDKKFVPIIKKNDVVVVTGFVGSNEIGEYTTFSRGGSDYSASILASTLNAEALEIWTDVDGVLDANPHIIPNAKRVARINYREAAELSYFGAKVLHPKTIEPVIQKKIPVRVLNTFNIGCPGTIIADSSPSGIKSIASRNSSHIIRLFSLEMLDSFTFLAEIFAVFKKYKLVSDVVSTSEASVSVTIDCAPSPAFIKELEKYAEVEIMPKKTVVCLVGEGICRQKDILIRIFNCVRKYPIRVISQDASPRNITLVVDKKDDKKIVRLIYNQLLKK